MSGFIQGECRDQATLFPEKLDDYITEENPIRVIDIFVDELDLASLGFKTLPKRTGRPGYHSAIMLKIYIYGYLNRVQSSRRLEREAQRNIELMWLTEKLMPDFKTIADFRKNNGKAIQQVCKEFVLICRKLELFTDAFVAIDGSKFKAVNNRDRNFTKAKVKRRMEEIDKSIARYLSQLESADRHETAATKENAVRLKGKIAALKKEMIAVKKLELELLATPDQQISLTDPDARSMKTRGQGIVGYNVQTAVDVKHHLITAHTVTNVGSDRSALYDTAMKAKDAMGADILKVVADRGYYNGSEIYNCEQSNIKVHLPKVQTSRNLAIGQYDKRDFIYHVKDDEYECPAGEKLKWRFKGPQGGKIIHNYWSSNCSACKIKNKCTTGEFRKVSRWEHEDVLDQVQDRLNQDSGFMKIRRNTVEHPFGTIKMWMGYTHFQMRTLENVSTEMSLHVLAYNLKRVMNIIGISSLMESLRA